MIDGFQLTEELISFEKGFDSWEEAIRASSAQLLKLGYIDQFYVNQMISSLKEHGPYVIIAPNMAIPHARPEFGSKKVGFSVMICDEPVKFSCEQGQCARLFITLSTVTSQMHLKVLQSLAIFMSKNDKIEKLINAKSKKEVLDIFNP